MPRTNEGVDYLVTLLTSPFPDNPDSGLGSHGPLLFAISESAEPINPTDTAMAQMYQNGVPIDALDIGVGSGIDGIIAHTSGSSSFTIISLETVASRSRMVFKFGIFVDPSLDGLSTPNASLIYEAMLGAPMLVNNGDHDFFMLNITI